MLYLPGTSNILDNCLPSISTICTTASGSAESVSISQLYRPPSCTPVSVYKKPFHNHRMRIYWYKKEQNDLRHLSLFYTPRGQITMHCNFEKLHCKILYGEKSGFFTYNFVVNQGKLKSSTKTSYFQCHNCFKNILKGFMVLCHFFTFTSNFQS